MEVGNLRERIITALLIYYFGNKNVISDIPTTKTEIDVIVFDKKISIKTLSGINYGGVKLIWTVDRDKSIEFKNNYKPVCDILLVRVNWNSEGGLFLIPDRKSVV